MLILLVFFHSSVAQVSFSAHTSVKNIASGQVFELTYSLEGGKMQDFRQPNFDPFEIVGGPNQSSQTTIINGHMTSNVSYRYSLLAQQEGSFTLQPAQVKVNGKWHMSNPITITVKASVDIGRPGNLAEANDLFIAMDISADTAYVGQQIIVDYILYSNVQTRGADIISEPEFTDFYAQFPRLFPRHPNKLTINDQLYEAKIIKRISLFPQFPGVFTLDKVNARVRVLLEGSKRNIFSLFERTESIMVQSNQDTLVVYSVPEDAPNGYVGAVGEYTIKPTLSKKTVKQNDAFSLRLGIRGNGDNKKIIAPELQADDSFVVYDAKLIEDEVTEFQGEVIGSKMFEYVIVPKEKGIYNIPVHFSYFDPNIPDFVQSEFPSLTITVAVGQENDRGEAILFDHNLESQNSETKKLSPWLIPSGGGILLLGALAFLLLKKRSEDMDVDEPEIDWDQRARTYLVVAKDRINDENGTTFYESLRHGVYRYVGQKLELPMSELTKEKVFDLLRSSEIDHNILDELMVIISASEMALFAGVDDLSKRTELYDQSVGIISQLEKHFIQSEV